MLLYNKMINKVIVGDILEGAKDKLKVSIIIPNYNNGRYIEECLNSVLNQTLKDIEIIVIDDCSTDDSMEILRSFQTKYPDKIKVIRNQENSGAGLSRNNGLDIATGEFIKFLDADDTMNPDVLEKMYNAAKKNNVRAVLGVVSIMQSTKHKQDNYNVNNNYEVINIEESKEDLIYGSTGVGDGLFARELFDKIRFPNLKWEDLATIPALRVEAGSIYYIDESVYNYRVYGESTTGVDMCKKTPRVFDIVQCLNKMRKEIPQEYATELDAVQYMHYQLRMKDIASWEDCSEEHKKFLINSLYKIMRIQIPDLDRNPYIKIMRTMGKIQIDELRNGDYIQVGILDKEKTFENIQRRTENYYKYMNRYRKKTDEEKVNVSSYLDKTALEGEEDIEEILSSTRESNLSEQYLATLQEFEELIRDSDKGHKDIVRESLSMAQKIISNKELTQKDKMKIITSIYKILNKIIPNLNEMIQNVEEQSLYNGDDDINMYLDEGFIQSDSVDEILLNAQKLLSSEEFLKYSMARTTRAVLQNDTITPEDIRGSEQHENDNMMLSGKGTKGEGVEVDD